MGGRRKSDSSSSSSSSGEEDGDADWKAAINSVTSNGNGLPSSSTAQNENHKPQNIKLYQIKAGKLLEDLLDRTIEVVSERALIVEEFPAAEDAGVRLFRRAPPGILFDQRAALMLPEELHGPTKKPKIAPGEELDEKSKKFKKQLQSIAVDGADIIVAARRLGQKSLAKLEAREIAAKTAAKKEEERVAELKRIRGERWLPCLAREMRGSRR